MIAALVLDYVRTPRGKGTAKGSLHDHTAVDLVVHLQQALVERTGLRPETVDDITLGCATQVDDQGADIARTAALLAGWGDDVPGATINRFCASGVDAVGQTAARVRAGDLRLAVAGGVESVSRVPMFADRGPLYCDPPTTRRIGAVLMGIAADLNATLEGFSREELDAYGLETQLKAAAAWGAGTFHRSVVPVPATADRGGLDHDELVRPGTTLESLAALAPAFAEAFSALCLRFRRDLGAGPDRMNPNGGTMAMGHAFGATGAILVGSCVEELERRGGRYGVAAVGGAAGLGVAVLIERVAA